MSSRYILGGLTFWKPSGHYRGAVNINRIWYYYDGLWERQQVGTGLVRCNGRQPSNPSRIYSVPLCLLLVLKDPLEVGLLLFLHVYHCKNQWTQAFLLIHYNSKRSVNTTILKEPGPGCIKILRIT